MHRPAGTLVVPLAFLAVLFSPVRAWPGVETPLRGNVGIRSVSGGDAANPLWKLPLGNDEFRRALRRSLDATGLLERARDEGRYALSVELASCSQSDLGGMVTTVVVYTLVDKLTGAAVFRDSIASEYGAGAWDRLMTTVKTRARGSFRANIGIMNGRLFELGPESFVAP